jgi:hypothetical protein
LKTENGASTVPDAQAVRLTKRPKPKGRYSKVNPPEKQAQTRWVRGAAFSCSPDGLLYNETVFILAGRGL